MRNVTAETMWTVVTTNAGIAAYSVDALWKVVRQGHGVHLLRFVDSGTQSRWELERFVLTTRKLTALTNDVRWSDVNADPVNVNDLFPTERRMIDSNTEKLNF